VRSTGPLASCLTRPRSIRDPLLSFLFIIDHSYRWGVPIAIALLSMVAKRTSVDDVVVPTSFGGLHGHLLETGLPDNPDQLSTNARISWALSTSSLIQRTSLGGAEKQPSMASRWIVRQGSSMRFLSVTA